VSLVVGVFGSVGFCYTPLDGVGALADSNVEWDGYGNYVGM
jgi:hypothetical protein